MAADRALCVFAGSSPGSDSAYAEAARSLGALLSARGIRLIYGGGHVGLMGVVADAVLAGGGSVTGVIPRALHEKEVGHSGLTELVVVETMHERKTLMADLSDGFIALPGGIGTLEELFEALTWTQLGIHSKACGLYNVAGYYDRLLAFLDDMREQQFLKTAHREMLLADTDPEALLDAMHRFEAPVLGKWWKTQP